MRAKIRGSVASQRAQRHIRDRRQRLERIRTHKQTLAVLREALSKKDPSDKATDLRRRIRTLEQQIRYMGGES